MGNSSNDTLKAGILAFAVVALWGLTFVSFTVTGRYFTSVQVMMLRCIIAYVSMLVIYPKFHKSEGLAQELLLLCAGASGTTCYIILSNVALKYTATSNVSVLSSLSPIFTALLMPFFFRGSKIKGRVFIGFIVATVGAWLVSTGGKFELTGVFGCVLAILSAICWAVYSLILRKNKSSLPQIYITRRIFLYGIITVVPICIFRGFTAGEWVRILEEKLMPRIEEARKNGKIVGVGVASGWRSVAGGLGPAENAGAEYILKPDGRVDYYIACTEMGQGSHTSLTQMAAEVTGIAWEDFDITAGDTSIVPYGGGVMASRGLFLWGHPTIAAGEKFKKKLLEASAALLNKEVDQLEIKDSKIFDQEGNVLLTLKELAQKTSKPLKELVDFHLPKSCPVLPNLNEDHAVPDSEYRPHHTVAYNTTLAMVEINPEKGSVEVPYIGAVCDGGQIVNPEAASTQIEGGLIMGSGYGLTENFKVENGVNVTNTLGKVKMLRFDAIPEEIEVKFAQADDPTGPFGSKGVAEISVLTPAPAICNAIHDAVGYRLHTLPVSEFQEQIKEAAKNK